MGRGTETGAQFWDSHSGPAEGSEASRRAGSLQEEGSGVHEQHSRNQYEAFGA